MSSRRLQSLFRLRLLGTSNCQRRGNSVVNNVAGVINACIEDDSCQFGMMSLIGAGVGLIHGGLTFGLSTRAVRSANQMNKQIQSGKAPGSVKRVDVGKVKTSRIMFILRTATRSTETVPGNTEDESSQTRSESFWKTVVFRRRGLRSQDR